MCQELTRSKGRDPASLTMRFCTLGYSRRVQLARDGTIADSGVR